jgi:hypothetical protein
VGAVKAGVETEVEVEVKVVEPFLIRVVRFVS